MYLLALVAELSPETVNAYSSQGSTALHVGVPVAWDEGLATRYGPPVKLSVPLESVRVPLFGVVAAKLTRASARPVAKRTKARKMRGLKMPDSKALFCRIRI